MANPSPSTDAVQEVHRRVAALPENLRPNERGWRIQCLSAGDGWWVAAAFFQNGGTKVVDGSGEPITARYRPIVGDLAEVPKPPYRNPYPRPPMAGAGGENRGGTVRRTARVGEDAA